MADDEDAESAAEDSAIVSTTSCEVELMAPPTLTTSSRLVTTFSQRHISNELMSRHRILFDKAFMWAFVAMRSQNAQLQFSHIDIEQHFDELKVLAKLIWADIERRFGAAEKPLSMSDEAARASELGITHAEYASAKVLLQEMRKSPQARDHVVNMIALVIPSYGIWYEKYKADLEHYASTEMGQKIQSSPRFCIAGVLGTLGTGIAMYQLPLVVNYPLLCGIGGGLTYAFSYLTVFHSLPRKLSKRRLDKTTKDLEPVFADLRSGRLLEEMQNLDAVRRTQRDYQTRLFSDQAVASLINASAAVEKQLAGELEQSELQPSVFGRALEEHLESNSSLLLQLESYWKAQEAWGDVVALLQNFRTTERAPRIEAIQKLIPELQTKIQFLDGLSQFLVIARDNILKIQEHGPAFAEKLRRWIADQKLTGSPAHFAEARAASLEQLNEATKIWLEYVQQQIDQIHLFKQSLEQLKESVNRPQSVANAQYLDDKFVKASGDFLRTLDENLNNVPEEK